MHFLGTTSMEVIGSTVASRVVPLKSHSHDVITSAARVGDSRAGDKEHFLSTCCIPRTARMVLPAFLYIAFHHNPREHMVE